jgi:hypothetical protein
MNEQVLIGRRARQGAAGEAGALALEAQINVFIDARLWPRTAPDGKQSRAKRAKPAA